VATTVILVLAVFPKPPLPLQGMKISELKSFVPADAKSSARKLLLVEAVMKIGVSSVLLVAPIALWR
jgi:hypothetical protein